MADGPSTQPPILSDARATGLIPATGELDFASTQLQQQQPLSRTARRNIENLGLTVVNDNPADTIVALQTGAAKIREAVESPAFRVFLERTFAPSAKIDPAQGKIIFPDGQERTERLDALVKVALKIVDNAVEEFSRQSAGAAAKGRTMENKQVGLVTLVTQKISGLPVREFVDGLTEEQKIREALVGTVRNGIRDAIGAALVVGGHTVREHLPAQRQLVNIGALNLDFLSRPDGNEVHNKMDAARMAIAARNQNPARVRDFLLAVEDMPRMPMGPRYEELSLQLSRRMQRATANLLQRHVQDPVGEAHFKTVAILKDVFSSGAILFHPYSHDNDAAVVDQIYRAVQRGNITLAAASCPNYSGSYGRDPKTGTPRWEYDFQSLGTGAGIVAERGLDYVQAWHSILSQHLGEGNVRFWHYEGTFEIAEGFKSNTPDGSGDRDYLSAVNCLVQSGEAVRQLYADRFGIKAESHLTSEAIPDADFDRIKMERAESIRAEMATNLQLRALAETIVQGRIGLYAKWFPMDPSTEDDAAYISRIVRTKVPENIAEYELLGKILCGSNNDTLVLAYDSPIMGEVYAMNGMPVISGQGATSSAYLGA